MRSSASVLWLVAAACQPDDGTANGDPAENRSWTDEAEVRGLFGQGPAYGRGASVVDVDGDGWEDIWQSDGGAGVSGHESRSTLWRNIGDADFEAFDIGLPTNALLANWSGAWADYDGDGDPDVLLANGGYQEAGDLRLFRNDLATDGSFTDVTDGSGLTTAIEAWWGAAWADFDMDGALDVVVDSTSKYTPSASVRLYKGDGRGGFADVTGAVGVLSTGSDNKNPVWFDFDNDLDLDLFVAVHDRSPGRSTLWRNDRTVFTDVSEEAFADIDVLSRVFAAAAADFDQDGHLDLYLGRFFEQDYVAVNQGDGTFELVSTDVGLDMVTGDRRDLDLRFENTMGLVVGDLTGEGRPDVVIGTGNPDRDGPALVYCQTGDGFGFERCSDDFEAGMADARHHGATMGDLDRDGDVDLFWNLGGKPGSGEEGGPVSRLPALFIQHPVADSTTATVRLVGAGGLTDAIGARYEVLTSRRTHFHMVTSSQGFQSQVSPWQVIGLDGDDDAIVVVTWPDGEVSEHTVAAGDRVDLRQGG